MKSFHLLVMYQFIRAIWILLHWFKLYLMFTVWSSTETSQLMILESNRCYSRFRFVFTSCSSNENSLLLSVVSWLFWWYLSILRRTANSLNCSFVSWQMMKRTMTSGEICCYSSKNSVHSLRPWLSKIKKLSLRCVLHYVCHSHFLGDSLLSCF